MLIHIPELFSSEEVRDIRATLEQAPWISGKTTAGLQSANAKHNRQLAEGHPAGQKIAEIMLQRAWRSPLFFSATLPRAVFPPLFNRYDEGDAFGYHIDNAIRPLRNSPEHIRTDISATLFLSAPESYDGGELVIQDIFATHRVKLDAGCMVIYPSSSLHKVEPVTRGTRLASFFWIQSMVRDDAQRRLLFEMDQAIQGLASELPDHASVLSLTGSYHNLLRRWADV
ncbi:Fe2+-dependent dioxygenase [Pseudomonas sp.]|uniref:Fe2+-dependent dioxygenase n=1 Tax=Pseudomonas sp. TaxID=306 RepID=UPI0028ABD384|nr:Fe2+-dependent dioxygenase [Pseudomonas sp.]